MINVLICSFEHVQDAVSHLGISFYQKESAQTEQDFRIAVVVVAADVVVAVVVQ